MSKQKQWELLLDKFYKGYDSINSQANKNNMNGEITTVAIEMYMRHLLNNTCIHTLQNVINDCFNRVIDEQINELKEHKKFKVGRAN
jgi:hypothetical protein